jgi:hypothetical protein
MINSPSNNSLYLHYKDTKNSIKQAGCSDFEILKFLKRKRSSYTEQAILILANKFNADVSRIRSLVHTAANSYNWI